MPKAGLKIHITSYADEQEFKQTVRIDNSINWYLAHLLHGRQAGGVTIVAWAFPREEYEMGFTYIQYGT